MKLLHCIHSVNPAGGGPINFLRQLADLRDELGFEMEVLCLDSPGQVQACELPFTVHALGPALPRYGYTPRLVPWLKEHHPLFDALVIQGLWQYTSFGTWLALHKTSTPYFVYAHGMLDPWFNKTYPLKHLKKLLYWPWAEYRVLSDARAVLFTCEEERLLARTAFQPYHCREIVVGHGTLAPAANLDYEGELFLQSFPQLRGKRLLLFLGRVHEKKGVDLLLSAFARVAPDHPYLQLVIAGPCSEDYKHKLNRLINTFAPAIKARITWTGMLLGGLKWGAMQSADAFLLPSHQENFGQSVTESLSCGTPVLISNKINIWREIEEDGAGLVEDDTLQGVENLLKRWLSMEKQESDEMRRRARISFDSRFELHIAVRRLLLELKNAL